jgi:tRNA-binding protein
MIEYKDFEKVDVRVGKIIKVEETEKLHISVYKMTINFRDEIGKKISIGQYTKNYLPKDLKNKLVMCVVNFEPKNIGKYVSDVLTLGFDDENGEAILAIPDQKIPLGTRLF